MKKLIAVVFAVSAALALMGCGQMEGLTYDAEVLTSIDGGDIHIVNMPEVVLDFTITNAVGVPELHSIAVEGLSNSIVNGTVELWMTDYGTECSQGTLVASLPFIANTPLGYIEQKDPAVIAAVNSLIVSPRFRACFVNPDGVDAWVKTWYVVNAEVRIGL
jgi:hypothetical protein